MTRHRKPMLSRKARLFTEILRRASGNPKRMPSAWFDFRKEMGVRFVLALYRPWLKPTKPCDIV